jgi:aspartate oxidase
MHCLPTLICALHVCIVRAAAAERMVAAVYSDAQQSTAHCAPLTDRMDAYKLAAEAGHTAGRVTYAHLLLTGREVSANYI